MVYILNLILKLNMMLFFVGLLPCTIVQAENLSRSSSFLTITDTIVSSQSVSSSKNILKTINDNKTSNIYVENYGYLTHMDGSDCVRYCELNQKPRICYYHWTLEHFHAMGPECKKCDHGVLDDCFAPECITADGVERGLLSINRRLPGPPIQVCVNDVIVVDVKNEMTGESTTIHWHGVVQHKTPFMDGVPFLTQCPIPYSTTFRYAFIAEDAGTYFYHSHSGHQRVDGIFGSLIIREPYETDPNADLYDFDMEEHTIMAADWMHTLANMIMPGLPSAHILPVNLIMNGRGRFTSKSNVTVKSPYEVYRVTSGYTYRFRFINGGSHICPMQLQIEDHSFTVIATDGNSVEPFDVDTVISTSGERYDFVLNANKRYGEYWVRLRALGSCIPLQIEQFAILSYAPTNVPTMKLTNPTRQIPQFSQVYPMGDVLNHPNASCMVPRNHSYCVTDLEGYKPNVRVDRDTPDQLFYLGFNNYQQNNQKLFTQSYDHFMNVGGDVNLMGAINNMSFIYPSFPLLTQSDDIDESMFCRENHLPNDCKNKDQCPCIHRLKFKLNAIIELVIFDEAPEIDTLNHPFHVHGFPFRVVGMGQHALNIPMTRELAEIMHTTGDTVYKPLGHIPPEKDTISIPSKGYVVLRFRATNPGFWLMHCHFDWHLAVGMALIMQIGEPKDMITGPIDFPRCGNYLPDVDSNLLRH